MITLDRVLKIIQNPHISEKTTIAVEKYHRVVLKVLKNATKFEIKTAVKRIFKVHVIKVNTLIVKGKRKRLNNGRYSFKSDWKKAYITLQKGQNLDLIGIENSK